MTFSDLLYAFGGKVVIDKQELGQCALQKRNRYNNEARQFVKHKPTNGYITALKAAHNSA